MYRIALIQNESEMLRYSWADIRPYIPHDKYMLESFTSENIDTFFHLLNENKLDAVIIAANACNDKRITKILRQEKESITKFLNRGNGLLVSFQMRLADDDVYGFLPDEYDVKAINRIKVKLEDPKNGNLTISDMGMNHPVLQFPNTLDIKEVKNHCLTNNTVQGLYWTYLQPLHQENYIPLFVDDSYDELRNIMLISNSSSKPRIILSSLSLDWQMHRSLWENALRYVVKNRPITAVITKRGQSNFDFRYLLAKLESEKAPYTTYVIDTFSRYILSPVHDLVILDPCWDETEIAIFLNDNQNLIKSGTLNVIVLKKKQNVLPNISIISNVRYQYNIRHEVLLWLQSIHKLQPMDKAYWQNSFWCTFEVISAFSYFEYPIEQYKESLLSEINTHNIDGSYDEVMGASCAMLQVYTLLLGINHEATKNTISWILQNITKKNLYEQSTALDILSSLGVIIDATIKNQILSGIANDVSDGISNEFYLLRYCKTLISCNKINEAYEIARKLAEKQDKIDGKWVNISNTAATIDVLLDLYATLTSTDTKIIEEMIFLGIQYIKSHFLEECEAWKRDAAASAKCIIVLDKFEKIVSLPVDLALQTITFTDKQNRTNNALRLASESNVELLKENNSLSAELEEKKTLLAKSKKLERQNNRLIIILVGIIMFGVSTIAITLKYLFESGYGFKIGTVLRVMGGKYIILLIATVPTIAFAVFIYLLIKKKSLPSWLKFGIKVVTSVDPDEVE